MLRFCANLSLLFTELPVLERIDAARQCGFTGIEIQFPYEVPAHTLQAAIQNAGLKLVLFNIPAGDLMTGGEGLAAVPGRQAQFRQALQQALVYAECLRPECVNLLAGRCLNTRCHEDYRAVFKQNLQYAADRLTSLGIKLVFEAINTYDMPGFLIADSAQQQQILSELAHPNVYLQYDVYHMYRMGEDPLRFIPSHVGQIAHIQFADVPGRAQPGSGCIDFEALFRMIETTGYRGWVGAEYQPSGLSQDSLAWYQDYCAR